MVFEGLTSPNKFIDLIRECLTSNDLKTGLPYWKELKSNVGTTYDDDGYVFQSKGSSGEENIIIGFMPPTIGYDKLSLNRWDYGNAFFVCDSYTPSNVNGVNGTFIGRRYFPIPLARNNAELSNSYSRNDNILKYFINVNSDRIIIMYWLEVNDTINYVYNNLIYIGCPEEYLADSTAKYLVQSNLIPVIIGSATGYGNGYYFGGDLPFSPIASHATQGTFTSSFLTPIATEIVKLSQANSFSWGDNLTIAELFVGLYNYGATFARLGVLISIDDGSYKNNDKIVIGNREYRIMRSSMNYGNAGGSIFPSSFGKNSTTTNYYLFVPTF